MATHRKWDVVVVGSANTDYTIRGKNLPEPGETAIGEQFLMEQGGKGANQAVAAARLGAQVAFVACIGDDERGNTMIQRLHTEGINTDYVVRAVDMPTGAAVIQVAESGEKQIFMAPNANHKLSVADIEAAKCIQNTRVLVAQLEIPLQVVMRTAQLATTAKVVLDPAPPVELSNALLRRLTVLKPNSSEAQYLTGLKVTDRNSARKAAEKLQKRGVPVIAIQAGDEGNLLVWQDGEVWLPHLDVDSIDATGAGDAFTAALCVAIAEGRSWEDAGQFANTAAALTTTKLGAQPALPHREAVESLLCETVSD